MLDALKKGRIFIPEGNPLEVGHYPFNTKVPMEKAILVKRAVQNRNGKSLKRLSIDLGVSYQYVRDISSGRILKNFEV